MPNPLQQLKDLISVLSKKEISALRNSFSKRGNDSHASLKSLELLHSLITDITIPPKELMFKIYPEGNKRAFDKLVSRLIDKVDEGLLLFDDQTFNPTGRGYHVLKLRRKMLITNIRRFRGINTDDLNNLDKIIQESLRYEVYETTIEALLLKRRIVLFRYGIKKVKHIDSNISYYRRLYSSIEEARFKFEKLGAIFMRSSSDVDYKDELLSEVKNLKRDIREFKSARLKWYYLLYMMQVSYSKENYKAAENFNKSLLDLAMNNIAIKGFDSLGSAFMNLAVVQIFLKNFDDALKNISRSKLNYPKATANYNLCCINEFYILYYMNLFDKAEDVIVKIYNYTQNMQTPLLLSQSAYLNACIKSRAGNAKESIKLLNEVKETEKDKEGWNVNKRILLIMNYIELNNFEGAEFETLRLEKFVKRISISRPLSKRYLLITRILVKLMNEGYDFERVGKQRAIQLELLSTSEGNYCWKIKSPELIKFHEWFSFKMAIFNKSIITSLQ